jgi:glycosyltransferase involved in cell wall biosynthesis
MQTLPLQARAVVGAFGPDVLVGIADITKHIEWQALMSINVPYIGIFPLESDPLIHPSEWTRVIDLMGMALLETEWATVLCKEVGLTARHIPIGIDCAFWRPPHPAERRAVRERMENDDKFVVLTVCDNHERKNLPAAMATVALLTGKTIEWPPGSGAALAPEAEYADVEMIINTKRRPESVGYTLWNLADLFGLQNECRFFQHEQGGGLSDEGLRDLYWAADAFLLTSKAEGLGLPVMEAMACGLPCVCTDTGGMKENLADGRGWLIPAEYSFLDPFGNQIRRFPSPAHAAALIKMVRESPEDRKARVKKALAWARRRTWARAADVLEEAMNGIAKTKAESPSENGAAAGEPAGYDAAAARER